MDFLDDSGAEEAVGEEGFKINKDYADRSVNMPTALEKS